MIPSNLIKAIDESDLNMAKTIVVRQLNTDRVCEDLFSKSWSDYAAQKLKEKGIDFFQKDDGFSAYVEDKSNWTKDLWETMRSEFTFNYSELKLQRIIDVMEHLREQGHPDFQVKNFKVEDSSATEATSNKSKKEQTYSSESKERSNRDYYIGGGAGAILGGVGGKLLGFGVAGIVVGVAVGLAVVYFKNNRG